jgi:multiple sugar transport system substrate-binding protein
MTRFIIIPMLIFSLVGCTAVSPQENTVTPGLAGTPTTTPTPTLPPTPTAAATKDPLATPSETVTLNVWVPPQFDPTDGSRAGQLLQARFDEFVARRPETRVEVRVKAVEGPGGLLDSLSAASAAAPLALPDLIALPRDLLETAAIKSLLHPYDPMLDTRDDPDLFTYAHQLAFLQDSTFGLPFAGDALILVYRPSVIDEPASDWGTALQTVGPLAFPASDPQSLFTLALYQSTGGTILDEEDRPTLNPIQLTEVLTFYHQAEQVDLMPYWLTQYETDAQSWGAYEAAQAQMAVTWISRYLADPPMDTATSPIPTRDGTPLTLATGWVWALGNPDPVQQVLSIELAQFLTTSDFLSKWTAAAGYLPPRPSSLAAWQSSPFKTVVSQIAPSAQLIPSQDVLAVLGPVLQKSTVDILKEQTDPNSATQTAIESLGRP